MAGITKSFEGSPSAILLIHCPDCQGIVAAVSRFIHENKGNIIYLDQHVDSERRVFFMRVQWELGGFAIAAGDIEKVFQKELGKKFGMKWELYFSQETPRLAIFVSKLSHCLYDLLSRWHAREWKVEIPLIVSNHEDLRSIAERFGIEFGHFPISAESKKAQEQKQLKLLSEHRVDLVVLARYMQILSADFISRYPDRIINIHHSFLPAFPGAKPYHSAHERGVKIIGATSHYVTSELDAGPIIEQDVARVTHKDSVADLIRKGKDLEKVVLSRAVWSHVNRQILAYDNRTVVFG